MNKQMILSINQFYKEYKLVIVYNIRKMTKNNTITSNMNNISKEDEETDWEMMNMISEYFERTKQAQEKHGKKTIVLMQCGTFFEVYSYKFPNDEEFQGSLIQEFSDLCNMQISRKKIKYKNNGEVVYMAGFRDYSLEKYLKRLVDEQFTVVVIIQQEKQTATSKKMTRIEKGVYSPGTHVAYEPDTDKQWNKHTMSIWVHQYKKQYIIGVAILNVFTGKTFISEQTITDSKLQMTSFDELDKCLNIYRPKEVLWVCDNPEVLENVHALRDMYMHKYTSEHNTVKNAEQQVYQRHILAKYFGEGAFSQCSEFSLYELATQSLCLLIHFIEERNPQLCRHLQMPVWENNSKYVFLANHALDQLNILDRNNHNSNSTSSLSSVHNWTNKCVTTMGKRQFLQLLTHPTYDEDALQCEYDIMNKWMTEHEEMIDLMRKQMKPIYDIDALTRQVITRRMYPCSLFRLYNSVHRIEQILVCMEEMPWMFSYLGISCWKTLKTQLHQFISFVENRVHLEYASTISQLSTFEQPLFKSGYYPPLDELMTEFKVRKSQLDTIQLFWERQMSPNSTVGTYVKRKPDKTTVTSHTNLQMTNTRCKALQQKMKDSKGEIMLDNGVKFYWKDVHFTPANKQNMEIRFPVCDMICKSLDDFQEKMNLLTQEIFLNILEEIENEHVDILDKCSEIISKFDVLLNKCFIAQKYHYTRPIIQNGAEKSFVKAYGLRHILIEHLNTQELYVSNDVLLGAEDDIDGMLLFGTNMAGKTSAMRALGICMIMAQAGLFVPCQKFIYKPYKSIFTRILNQDNLFKGQSTFSVEMSELRVIAQYANENSLVLGDELCSGTETVSALSIMMTSLLRLHERRSSFLFATHFHEILDFEELQNMKRLKCYHLTVSYDVDNDVLVYDRKLKEGSGPRSYGLDVCEALYLDKEFLEKACEIRRMHFPEYEGSLSQIKTHYNAQKVKDSCELCGKKCEEIHHLQEQQYADAGGYIANEFHKNHPANLMGLCEGCHLKMHHHDKDEMLKGDVSPLSENETLGTKPKRKIVKRVVRKKVINGTIVHTL